MIYKPSQSINLKQNKNAKQKQTKSNSESDYPQLSSNSLSVMRKKIYSKV